MSATDSIARDKLSPPEEFPFPFSPYGIQKDFMRELYATLEESKIGLFESPTGTVLAGWHIITIIMVDMRVYPAGKINEFDLWGA